MISIITQIVAGIAVLLGLVVAGLSGFSIYERRAGMSQTRARRPIIVAKVDAVGKIEKLICSIGIPQAVIQGYREARSALASASGLEEKIDQTEREIMQKIKTTPSLKSTEDELGRIYKTYERARFGSQAIPKGEVELFVKDLCKIYDKLVQNGNQRDVVN